MQSMQKRHTKNSAKDFQLQICLVLNSVKLHFATTKKVTRTEVWWFLSCCCCSCLLIIIINQATKVYSIDDVHIHKCICFINIMIMCVYVYETEAEATRSRLPNSYAKVIGYSYT